MLEKLRQYYDGHIIVDEFPEHREDYKWYTDHANRIVGIAKKKLTKKEEELLSVFLTPLSIEDTYLSAEQQTWKELLYNEQLENIDILLQKSIKLVRFLHFSLKEPFFEKRAWEEALSGLLSSSFLIIWKDDKNGVIIETYTYTDADTTLDTAIFQTLTTDFFVTPKVLVGKLRALDALLVSWFQWEQACFQAAKDYLKTQHIYQIEDILPYLFLEKTVSLTPLLNEVRKDEEVLKTVRTFLECNMNVSLAAKKQYMHRNSVQYRVDKFIEKTGIDIKDFKGAVAVYLALLLLDSPSS
ncbi:MAG: helix-turn-helix domain-containing protein [Ectobacillus sp.]